MRKTTEFLIAHLIEPLALIVESYIIHVTTNISDLATAGHWELLDFFMTTQNRLDDALYGAARGDSLTLVQHVLDRGANNYGGGIFGACCGTNLDAAKLIRMHELTHTEYVYYMSHCMHAIGKCGSVEMLDWFCNEFDPVSISSAVDGAIESGNLRMLSAVLSHGGEIHPMSMSAAGRSGSIAMVVLLSQYNKRYGTAFAGACLAGHLKLIKWFIARGVTDFGGVTNVHMNLDVMKYLATNSLLSTPLVTFALLSNLHVHDQSEYERDLISATGIHSNHWDSRTTIRWIVTEHPNLIDYEETCWRCTTAVKEHAIVKQCLGQT